MPKMRLPRGPGISLAGAGLGGCVWVAEKAGLELPSLLLIPVGVVVVAMFLGGLYVAFQDHRDHRTSTPDRVDRLREAYKEGATLLALPAWLSGPSPAGPVEATEGRARKRVAIHKWTEGSYGMLRDYFPQHASDFLPYCNRSGVWDAVDEELDERGDAEAYLSAKLAVLEGLLKRYD